MWESTLAYAFNSVKEHDLVKALRLLDAAPHPAPVEKSRVSKRQGETPGCCTGTSDTSSRLQYIALMSARAQLAPEAVKDISQRLSSDLSLRLPASLQRDQTEPVTPQKRKEYVTALLERDPGVFLERYSSKLSEQERARFEPLRDDYEVDLP